MRLFFPDRRASIVAATCGALAGTAVAQTPPSAGTLLESVRPAPTSPPRSVDAVPEAPTRPALKLDATVKIAVASVAITGAKVFPADELQALVADAVGKELTLADLDDYARRITARYHADGYLLARAYLPAQDIVDGNVEIAVLEGRLGKLLIENRSSLSDANVAARLDALREGKVVDGAILERSLLLLNDLPGIEVKSTLKPGASVGTTDLDIQLAPKAPYAGTLELDNYGNRYTGDMRLGGSFTAGNLAGLGDALSLRAVAADGMSYARAAWQTPLGSEGTQAGFAWSDMRYQLGKDFASLHSHGTATVGSAYLLHPFVRGRMANINGQINVEQKRLHDAVDSTATVTDKRFDNLTLGLSGDRTDAFAGGGFTTWSVNYVAGNLKLDPASKALDDAGHRAAGSFGKTSLAASRLNALPEDFLLYLSIQAQIAAKNLDGAEKMGLGGAQAVRAYPQGESASDNAVLGTIELRRALAPGWMVSLFQDVGQGRINHSPLAADAHNVRRISGTGLGLAWTAGDGLSLQIGIAWRDTAQPTSDVDRIPRAWVQFIQRF